MKNNTKIKHEYRDTPENGKHLYSWVENNSKTYFVSSKINETSPICEEQHEFLLYKKINETPGTPS